jgi:UDP-N-acetylglucosamine 2-epimerase (non-hydrolysing)
LNPDLTQVGRALIHSMISERFILATLHRRETFGAKLRGIFQAFRSVSDSLGIPILIPLHPNPDVRREAEAELRGAKQVYVVDPLDYLNFVYLMSECAAIVTDSGGIQEEAPYFGKPVLVVRNATERLEAVEAGASLLIGTSNTVVFDQIARLFSDNEHYKRMAVPRMIFGDGHAADLIADVCAKYLENRI